MSLPLGAPVASASTRSAAMRIVLTSPQGTCKSMMTTLRFDGQTTAGDLLGLLADQEGLASEEADQFVIRTPEMVLSADVHLKSLSMDTLPYLEHVPRLQRIKITSQDSTPVTKTLSLDAVVPLAQLMATIAPEFGLKDDQSSLSLLSLVCPHPPIIFNDLQETEVNFLVSTGVATLTGAQAGQSAQAETPSPSSDAGSASNGGNAVWSISATTSLPTSAHLPSNGSGSGIELDFSQSLFQQGVRTGAHLQIVKRKRSFMHKLLGKRKSLLPTTAKEKALAEVTAASGLSRVSRASPTFITKIITCIHEYFCHHPQKLSSQVSPVGALSGSSTSITQSNSAPEGLSISFTVTHPSLFLKDYSQSFLLAYKILLESSTSPGALADMDHYDDGRALGALLRHCLAVMDPRLLEPIQVELFSLQSPDQFQSSLPHFINKLNQEERAMFVAWAHLCHELSTLSLACSSDRIATIFAPLFCHAAANDDSILSTTSKSSPAISSPKSPRSGGSSSPRQRQTDHFSAATSSTFSSSSPRGKMISIISFMIDNASLFGDSPFVASLPSANGINGSPGGSTTSVSSGSSHSPTGSFSSKPASKKSMKKEKSSKALKKHATSTSSPASPASLNGTGTSSSNLTGLRNSSEDDTPASGRSRSDTEDSSALSQSRSNSQPRLSQTHTSQQVQSQRQSQAANTQGTLADSASSPTSPGLAVNSPIGMSSGRSGAGSIGATAGVGGPSQAGVRGGAEGSSATSSGLAGTSSNTMFMVADFAWTPSMEGDIELHKGDVLQVLVADAQGWYVGKLLNVPGNPVGVFPSTYCSIISKKDVFTLLKLEETLLFESDDMASSDDSSSSFSTSSLYQHLVAARSGGYYASSNSGLSKWPSAASPPLQSPSSPTHGSATARAGSAFSPAAIAASKAKTAALAGSQEAILASSPLASPIDLPSSFSSSSSSNDVATTPPHVPKHLSTSAVVKRSPRKENDPTEIVPPDPAASVNASSPTALALQESWSSPKELMIKSASTGILGGAESEPIVALQPASVVATTLDQQQDLPSRSDTVQLHYQRKSQEVVKSSSITIGLASESVKPIHPSAEATAHRKAYPVPPPKGLSSKSLPKFAGSEGSKPSTPASASESPKNGPDSSPATLNNSPHSSPSSTRDMNTEISPSNRRPISRAQTTIVQHQRSHHTTSPHSHPPQVPQNQSKSNRTSLPDPITVPLDIVVRPHFQSGIVHHGQGSHFVVGSSPRQASSNAAEGSVGSMHHSRTASGHVGIPRIPLVESSSGPGGWGSSSSHNAAHSMRRLSGPRVSPRNEFSHNSASSNFRSWNGNQGGPEARNSVGSARGSPRGGSSLDNGSMRLSALTSEEELDKRRREVMQLHTTVFALEENNKAMRDTVTEQELAIARLTRELELLKAHSMHVAAQQQQQTSSVLSNSNDSIDGGSSEAGSGGTNGGDSPSSLTGVPTSPTAEHETAGETSHKAHPLRPRKRPSRRISAQEHSPATLTSSFPPSNTNAPTHGSTSNPPSTAQPEAQQLTSSTSALTPPVVSPPTPPLAQAPQIVIPLTMQLSFLVLAIAILLWVLQPLLR